MDRKQLFTTENEIKYNQKPGYKKMRLIFVRFIHIQIFRVLFVYISQFFLPLLEL